MTCHAAGVGPEIIAKAREATEQEIRDLLFANVLVKHTKSNAIVLAKGEQLVASGVGQTSRVDALKQAIASVHELGASSEENQCVFSDDDIAVMPADFAKDIAKQIREAAELGDVMTLNTVAEAVKSRDASCEPLSKQIIQMAEDFDLEGIQKLADLLDGCD